MANFVTAKLIAEKALPLLKDYISFLPLVNRDYDGTYKKAGDTIQVTKPARTTTVDGSSSISGSYHEINESSVNVTLDTERSVPFVITAKQMSLNVDDFTRQVIEPAVTAIAEYVNASIAEKYVDIPYYVGTAGTTPSALTDLASVRKSLNTTRAPKSMRSLVMDFDAEEKFVSLDSLVEVDKAGTNSALRDASLGRVYGMTLVADSDIKTHTAGGYTALADVTITAGALGATSIKLESTAGASTAKLLKGDLLSIDGYQFVVTADTLAAVSGDIATVAIYPALPKAFGDFTSADVTFADVTAGGHVANLAFQKDAFCFATAPLAPPMGGAKGYTVMADGLSLSVVQDYDIDTNQNKWRMDILYTVETLYPELATVLLG